VVKAWLLIPLALSAASAQQTCKDSAGFVRTLGMDTIDVESVFFMRDSVMGFQGSKAGLVAYTAWLNDSLIVTQAEMGIWRAGAPLADTPNQQGAYRRMRDSVLFGVRSPERPNQLQQWPNAPGMTFLLDAMTGLEELLTRRAVTAGRRDLKVPAFYPGRSTNPTLTVHFAGRDSVVIASTTGTVMSMTVDSIGRLLTATYSGAGIRSDSAVVVRRVPCGVVDSIIRRIVR
jgi:hypothetical protein